MLVLAAGIALAQRRLIYLLLAFGALCSGALRGLDVCNADGSPGPGLGYLFVLGTFGGLFLNSTIPLFYELVLEVTFPEPEATVLILLTNMNNIACIFFLSIPNTCERARRARGARARACKRERAHEPEPARARTSPSPQGPPPCPPLRRAWHQLALCGHGCRARNRDTDCLR